jgi:hypothetical protein
MGVQEQDIQWSASIFWPGGHKKKLINHLTNINIWFIFSVEMKLLGKSQ